MAVWFGVMPDVISFLPHLVVEHFSGGQSLFDATYRVTHSLVVFGLVGSAVGLIMWRMPWFMVPWGLHVVIDIFTHPETYYATPYLYPFESPYLGAVDYRAPWFLVTNWVVIGIVAGLVWSRERRADHLHF